MNPAVVVRHGRNLLSVMEINANRLIGREMVPMRTDILAIEPTSACNLKCSFCAYVKKDSPKITMKNDRFAGYVGQAVAMGYRRFHLTPNTGDIFMDRRIFDKLAFLEEHPERRGVSVLHQFHDPRLRRYRPPGNAQEAQVHDHQHLRP